MSRGILLCLGSTNVDIQMRAPRSPGPSETLPVTDFLMVGGGKGANRAFFGRKLGAPTVLLGRVGDDLLAEEALRPLRAIGVDLRQTRAVPKTPTGVAAILVRPDGQKTILLAENANDRWEPEGAEEVARACRSAPPESVLSLDLEIPPVVAARALEAARERGLSVVLDPSPADRYRESYGPLADFVTPNPVEAEQLTGIRVESLEDAFRAGRALCDRGVAHALVKLGARGTVLVNEEGERHFPAPHVDPVDTTGAGDAFAGALAFALWERQPTADAVRFAIAASALATTAYGSQASYPERGRIDALLR